MPCELAIVGISTELPSGSYSTSNLDHETFYRFLMDRGQSYERIPADRFNIDGWKGNGLAEIHVEQGSFLKDIDTFDNVEFGISSRDTKYMAPVTRKLLENCFLALLDSGIDYRAKKVGCFTSGNSWELMNVSEPDEYDARGTFSSLPAMVANRISNHLDLLGPSLPTDTACSSTLTALHLAVQAILNGDCEAAVVGGCQLNHRFLDWITYSQGGILSRDGKCKPFDSSADGFARAEGCVAIVLKPLDQAIADHDRVYATVLGVAINSTGAGAPPGAPVADAQREAMTQAFGRSGVSPQEVDYIEAHATGTAKGDPTEANWIGEWFQRKDELLIGSVKGNIGHTEIAAFLASLSKVISIFKHGIIPPNVNLTKLNPAIHWDQYKLRVPREPTVLPCRNSRSLVAIASSGIGGSNGHAVIQSPPTMVSLHDDEESRLNRPVLFMACGLSPRSATAVGDCVQQFLQDEVDRAALSTVLGRRSKQMTWRSFSVATSEGSPPLFSTPQFCSRTPRQMVMIFSGQGPQHKDMGRVLFRMFPVFRDSVVEMDSVFMKVTGRSLRADYGLFDVTPFPELSEVWPISLILPSLTVFQIALFDLLVSLGVRPDILIGHSAGETAVLYASGAAPKAMAVELAILRGRVFSSLEDLGGTMAALSCGPHEASELIAVHQAENTSTIVEIACFNSPSAVAISGHVDAVDRVLELARARDIFGRKLRTRVPIHSSMMEACRMEYCAGLRELFNRYPGEHVPQIPTYSTFTGELFLGPFDTEYFWNNTRYPVRFAQAIEALGPSRRFTFVESAPHPVLSSYITSMVDQSCPVLWAVRRSKVGKALSEYTDLLNICGQLTVSGHNCINFTVLNSRACYELDKQMPAYPFTKKRFPLYPDTPGYAKQMDSRWGPLNHRYLKVNNETHPTLGEHVVRGEPIMPAAGYLEMAFEFGASALMNVNLRSILSLSSEAPVKVNISLDGSYWAVKSVVSSSFVRKDTENASIETLHADGYLSFEKPSPCDALDIAAIRRRCETCVDTDFYPSLSYFSTYGTHLQRVTNAYLSSNEALVSVRGLDETLSREGIYVLHPAVLDACFHVMTYKRFHGDFNPNVYYLPSFVKAVILHQPVRAKYLPAHLYAHVEFTRWTPDSMCYHIVLADDLGRPLCTLQEFKMTKHRLNPLPDISRPFEVLLQPALHHLSKGALTDAVNGKRSCIHQGGSRAQTIALRELNVEGITVYPDVQPVSQGVDLALLQSSQSMRDAISTISATRQVIRLLIVSNVKTLLTQVQNLVLEFPSLFFEIATSGSELLFPKMRNANAFPVNIDFADFSQTTPIHAFDFVVVFDSATGSLGFDAVIRRCSQLLLPGGLLTMTVLDPDNSDRGLKYVVGGTASPAQEEVLLQSYSTHLQQAGFLTFSTNCFSTSIGAHFITMLAGRLDLAETEEVATLGPSIPLIFHYEMGEEIALQQLVCKLDVSQKCEIWIVASKGLCGGASRGLIRALRREYRLWVLRLFIFPSCYTKEMQTNVLRRLPTHIQYEAEIEFSSDAQPMVPRMLPLPPSSTSPVSPADTRALPPNHVSVSLRYASTRGSISGFIGVVVDSHGSNVDEGTLVAGFRDDTSEDPFPIDVMTLCPIPHDLTHHGLTAAGRIPGFTAAVLAPGISTFNHPHRLRSLAILLTHCDTEIGLDIKDAYSARGVRLKTLSRTVSLLDMAGLQSESFDLVISGYEDAPHQQILRTLLKPECGRLFLWNDPHTGLLALQHQDPCGVGDAIRVAIHLLEEHTPALRSPSYAPSNPIVPRGIVSSTVPAGRITFRQDKTYLLLGGIGSLGAHIALMMYERGARHIVLTSRSGYKSLERHKNTSTRRMFNYLRSLDDLSIRFEAVDAVSEVNMQILLASVELSLGGCIILTAALYDGLFQHLTENEFTSSFASKVGVLDTLKRVVDLQSLDFVIAFSSVSGLFGIESQSNYDASNTALEEALSDVPNGFSFVCPGILDSSLMSVGDEAQDVYFGHIIEWATSAEDMICWLEDAIYRFQTGQRFRQYIPDLNWKALDRTLGMTRIGRHIVPAWSVAPVSSVDQADGIADVVRKVLSIPLDDFSPEVPLTNYGLDSLSASRLSFSLRPFLEVSQIQLLANTSLQDLQGKVSTSSSYSCSTKQESSGERTEAQMMEELLAKYTRDMHPRATTSAGAAPLAREEVVLVTGTTGAYGCNILAQLLGTDHVAQVYGFNRTGANGTSLRERQASILASQGLPASLVDSPKLVLVEGDLATEDFGISSCMMNKLLSSVTHIIHNAWRVNFGTPLIGFEDLIKGTRNLLDFAVHSRLETPPSLSYISSIGVYQFCEDLQVAPEAPILDAKISARTGYLESKWVTERVVQVAAAKMSLRTNVIRVGLLSGSINGAWNTAHWFPALVQSGVHVGCLPEGEGVISWLPVDLAAAAVVDMRGAMGETLHLVHPHPVAWNTIMRPIASMLGLPLVPYREWFARLESSALDTATTVSPDTEDYDGPTTIHALKLMDMYRLGVKKPHPHQCSSMESLGLMPSVASEKGLRAAVTLMDRRLSRVLGPTDAAKWMRYWQNINYLPRRDGSS